MMDKLFEYGKQRILKGDFPDGWIKGALYIRIIAISQGTMDFVFGMCDPETGEKLFEHDEIFSLSESEEVTFLSSDEADFNFSSKIKLGSM